MTFLKKHSPFVTAELLKSSHELDTRGTVTTQAVLTQTLPAYVTLHQSLVFPSLLQSQKIEGLVTKVTPPQLMTVSFPLMLLAACQLPSLGRLNNYNPLSAVKHALLPFQQQH